MEIKVSKINGKDVSRYKNAETDMKTFFYDESFEDYKDALYVSQENDNGFKEMKIEVEFNLEESDDKPFYEKMINELKESQDKVTRDLLNGNE